MVSGETGLSGRRPLTDADLLENFNEFFVTLTEDLGQIHVLELAFLRVSVRSTVFYMRTHLPCTTAECPLVSIVEYDSCSHFLLSQWYFEGLYSGSLLSSLPQSTQCPKGFTGDNWQNCARINLRL